eukprot:3330155-Alexandrium_andersonii.AAC.1
MVYLGFVEGGTGAKFISTKCVEVCALAWLDGTLKDPQSPSPPETPPKEYLEELPPKPQMSVLTWAMQDGTQTLQ